MRNISIVIAGAVAIAAVVGGVYLATKPGSPSAQSAPAPGAGTAAPAAPAALPPELQITATDHAMGPADAAVTIVEYASMTCGHCASFHTTVLPELKKKYVDTGKVRFVYRDFPLDEVAARAAQLAECVGNERYFAIVDMIFRGQAQWAAAKDPIAELVKSLRIAGLPEDAAKTCLADQKVLDAILLERQGGDKLGVNSTPTLFVNGQRLTGGRTMAELDEILSKLIK
ncbi:MAG: DsbA family protein [Rhodospirillales bacterium]|nr:MAG: DsbA family protein [Rhodospirillales bacterium]